MAILINLHVHQLSLAIHIFIQFHEFWFIGTLIMVILQILNQFKKNNSCINDAILIKLNVHRHFMMMNIRFKFHEILFTGYLVTAPFVNFTLIQGQ